MKRFFGSLALACLVALPAVAGNIPTDGVTAPTPDPTETITEPGDVPSVGSSYEITGTALELIQMFLGVGV